MNQSSARQSFSRNTSMNKSLSAAELSLLSVFRRFMIGPGEMLCFYGPELKKHRPALTRLTDQGFLIKERFQGGYALTRSGFAAMTANGGRTESEDAPGQQRRRK
jgi:hypothetical protein